MAKVLAIDQTRFDEPQPVYNFTVKGPHTYFVLDAGVLVHNASCLDDVRGVFDQFEHKGIYSIDLRVIGQHGELRRQVKELVSDYPGETNYIYALVDAEVGDVLKVGKTTNPLGRFPNYGTTQRNFLTAHECHGTEYFTHLELHIMIGPPIPERKTLNSVEDKVRARFRARGYVLGWDAERRALEHVGGGPGTPFLGNKDPRPPGRRRQGADGWEWDEFGNLFKLHWDGSRTFVRSADWWRRN